MTYLDVGKLTWKRNPVEPKETLRAESNKVQITESVTALPFGHLRSSVNLALGSMIGLQNAVPSVSQGPWEGHGSSCFLR